MLEELVLPVFCRVRRLAVLGGFGGGIAGVGGVGCEEEEEEAPALTEAVLLTWRLDLLLVMAVEAVAAVAEANAEKVNMGAMNDELGRDEEDKRLSDA